jgi:hypothetical protein
VGVHDRRLPLETGDSIFIAFPDERFNAEFCSMHAYVDSVTGRSLIAAATRRFGPGTVPQQPGLEVGTSPPSRGFEALVAVGLPMAIIVVGLFGAVAVLAWSGRNRRP